MIAVYSRNLSKTLSVMGLLAALVVAGCARSSQAPVSSPPPAGATSATRAVPPAPAGPYGDLTIVLSTFGGENLDPARGGGPDVWLLQTPIYEPLIWSKMGDLKPGLAEKWEMAADGLSWTFSIRKGVKFHNGNELTAKDVKFSIERFIAPDAYFSYLRAMVDRVEIVDNNTVRVLTKGPQPFLALQVSNLMSPSQGYVMSKDYADQNPAGYTTEHPMGTGPFKFLKHLKGDSVTYEALSSHWRQTPAFKNLAVELVPEESTRAAMLRAGAADVVDVGLDAARELQKAGFRTPNLLDTQGFEVFIHGAYDSRARGMPVTDLRVRQALSLAINRDEIRKSFFTGTDTPPMPANILESEMDLDTAYWKSYAANAYRYDAEAAKDLLKAAGYPNGFSIKLLAYPQPGTTYMPKLAEVIAGYWSRVGVKAEVLTFDQGVGREMQNLQKRADLMGQASMYRYSYNPAPIKDLQAAYHSKGSVGLFGKDMPEMDKLIDAAYSEVDAAKRNDLMAKVVKLGTDTYTAITIGGAHPVTALSDRVDIDFDKPRSYLTLFAEIAKHRAQ